MYQKSLGVHGSSVLTVIMTSDGVLITMLGYISFGKRIAFIILTLP